MSAGLIPAPPEANPDLSERSALVADVILAFEAAAKARGAPTAEIRKGQLGLLEAFGLLGDAGGSPLSVVQEAEVELPAIAPLRPDDDLIRGFLLDQRRRSLRPPTIRVRRIMLTRASAELPNGLAGAVRADLEAWLDKHKLCARSRRSYLSHFKAFYTWALEDERLAVDPTARIRGPKIGRTTPRPIPHKELRRAIAKAGPTMRCWLLLGAYGGLRCQEMAGLDREDVIEEDGLLRVVQGKGGNERMVPLHPDVLAALQALPMPSRGPLFRRTQGHDRYPPSGVSEAINHHLHRHGIRSTAHSLRHWFGTSVYAQSQDIRLTQELLGHVSPTTTAIYTKVDATRAAPSVQALSVGASEAGDELLPVTREHLHRWLRSYLDPGAHPLDEHDLQSRPVLWELCGLLWNDTVAVDSVRLQHCDSGPCRLCIDSSQQRARRRHRKEDTYGTLARLVRAHLHLESAEDVAAGRLRVARKEDC